MDPKRMRQQAQVIRSKRLATPQRRSAPIQQSGFLHLSQPLPRKPKDVPFKSQTPSELRKIRSEQILEQRKALESIKKDESFSLQSSSPPTPPVTKKGCGGCQRKRGN